MASTKQLKSGVIRDCGCVPKTNARNGRVAEDLTGQRFGRLTALRPTERRDIKGSVYWMCRCDCGGQAEVPGDRLVQGNVLSCGCLKSENQKEIAGRLHRIDGICLEILKKGNTEETTKVVFAVFSA